MNLKELYSGVTRLHSYTVCCVFQNNKSMILQRVLKIIHKDVELRVLIINTREYLGVAGTCSLSFLTIYLELFRIRKSSHGYR